MKLAEWITNGWQTGFFSYRWKLLLIPPTPFHRASVAAAPFTKGKLGYLPLLKRVRGIYSATLPWSPLKFLQLSWLILLLPVSLLAQGPSDSPEKREMIIFPYQPEHVHAPTIVALPNGDMLAAWFQGSGERWADDVRIMGARLASGQKQWSEPFLMADQPGFPDINPVLFLDPQDRLWLVWYTVLANQWESSLLTYRLSEDYEGSSAPVWDWQENILVKPGDKTERGIQPGDAFVAAANKQLDEYEAYWQQDIRPQLSPEAVDEQAEQWPAFRRYVDSLASGENMMRSGRILRDNPPTETRLGYPLSRRLGWQTKNKPLILGQRIILPLYSDGLESTLFAITDDGGKQWQFSNPVVGGIGIQATIAQQADGTLVAYLRDNGPPPQRMQRTESHDRGESWSIARDTQLPNPGSGFDMVTLASGEWLIVYNDTEDGRHSLAVSISDDEGKSWPWTRHLEQDMRGEQASQSHYPSVIQDVEGTVHVIYSHHQNDQPTDSKSVKYVSFSPEWVKEVQP